MSETTINYTFNGGDPSQLSNVCLCDPTASFGARRTDTQAVIVAANTAMVQDSAGVYHFTFDDPAAGIEYEYWVQRTYRGNTTRRQGFKAAGTDAEPRYLEAADAVALLPSLLPLNYFPSASSAQQMVALTAATRDIDLAYRYQGRKFHPHQRLQFPRVAWEGGQLPGEFYLDLPADCIDGPIGSDVIWDWDRTLQEAVIPQRVLRACVYQADANLNPARAELLNRMHGGLKGQRVGSMSEDYELRPIEKMTLCRQADAEIAIYKLRAGRIL